MLNKKRTRWVLVVLLGCWAVVVLGRIGFARAAGAAAFDLDGRRVYPLRSIEGKAVVFIFLSVDCPISNQYAPEIQRLDAEFGRAGLKFWLVYPNEDETRQIIRKHTQEYLYHTAAIRDSEHALVKISQVHVTPEAAVFLPNGQLIYHGGIDDRYVDFGVERRQALRHELEEILTAVAEGKPIKPTMTKAVGCPIAEP